MANGSVSISNVEDIRELFVDLYCEEEFIFDKTGSKVVEILTPQFFADEPTIFGKLNQDYIDREITWYKSQSLSLDNFPGGAPNQWKVVASRSNKINSNYGFCIFSNANFSQYKNCRDELLSNAQSRRAVMIYNRPQMWVDYKVDGMSDFMCTSHVQYMIRSGQLICSVYMRSNDAIWGYRNDLAWQEFVYDTLYKELLVKYKDLTKGPTIWNVGSLHIYERHFPLLDFYIQTNAYNVTIEHAKEYLRSKENEIAS